MPQPINTSETCSKSLNTDAHYAPLHSRGLDQALRNIYD